ncbi:MAG: recombinase family protein [Thermoplasmatota archaeon]
MRPAGIYVRVSTKDQDEETQLPFVLEWCERNGFSVAPEHIFQEKISGRDPSRPEQKRAMNAAKGHHIEAMVCMRLDRWGRTTLDGLAKIERLKEWNVEFHAIKEGVHLTDWDTDARFRLELMQSLASRERNLISDRTRERFQHLEKQGWPNGRPGISKLEPYKPCAQCGAERDMALFGKVKGVRRPLCLACKTAKAAHVRKRGSINGMSDVQEEKPENSGGSTNDRLLTPDASKDATANDEQTGGGQ